MPGIQFHTSHQHITPRLLQAVGSIVLNWSMIDDVVSRMVRTFWKPADGQPPKSFDRRVQLLLDAAEPLYATEPDELRIFRWYIQRLRTASGWRDDVCHGQPGTITNGSKTYPGLMVPHPTGKTRFIPRKQSEIEKIATTLEDLHTESLIVSVALWAAQAASSPHIRVLQADGAFAPIKKENRSPMLPRKHPPPATFQG